MAVATRPRMFLLKPVLDKLGLSQRKLARLLGVKQNWVSRLANGHSEPGWMTLCRIAEILEISIGAFRAGDPVHCELFGKSPKAKRKEGVQ